jgi:hypothetical protein
MQVIAGKRSSYQDLSVQTGEACFASSGTNIKTTADGSFLALTGGKASRLLTPGSGYNYSFNPG